MIHTDGEKFHQLSRYRFFLASSQPNNPCHMSSDETDTTDPISQMKETQMSLQTSQIPQVVIVQEYIYILAEVDAFLPYTTSPTQR